MIDVPLAHVAGIPIEEMIGSFGPALLVGIAVAWARLRAGLRPPRAFTQVRTGRATHPHRSARRGGLLS